MGLDMYLYKKHYVKNWEHMKPEEKTFVEVTVTGAYKGLIKKDRISGITEDVAYWRKANAIHGWFVKNVQNGVDDCKEYYVSREQLKELLVAVEKVLDDSRLVDGKVVNGYTFSKFGKVANLKDGKKIEDVSVAHETLPVQEGFFFGGTDYDEYYWQDLLDTKKVLTELLAEPEGGDFYYSSSW